MISLVKIEYSQNVAYLIQWKSPGSAGGLPKFDSSGIQLGMARGVSLVWMKTGGRNMELTTVRAGWMTCDAVGTGGVSRVAKLAE